MNKVTFANIPTQNIMRKILSYNLSTNYINANKLRGTGSCTSISIKASKLKASDRANWSLFISLPWIYHGSLHGWLSNFLYRWKNIDDLISNLSNTYLLEEHRTASDCLHQRIPKDHNNIMINTNPPGLIESVIEIWIFCQNPTWRIILLWASYKLNKLDPRTEKWNSRSNIRN